MRGFKVEDYGTWRAEFRVSLSTPKTSAVNVITGLPASQGANNGRDEHQGPRQGAV